MVSRNVSRGRIAVLPNLETRRALQNVKNYDAFFQAGGTSGGEEKLIRERVSSSQVFY